MVKDDKSFEQRREELLKSRLITDNENQSSQYIESLVEDVVLNGESFESQLPIFVAFAENEGLDANQLKNDIIVLLDVLKSVSEQLSNSKKMGIIFQAQRCHISEEVMLRIISDLQEKKKTEQEEVEKRAREKAEAEKRAEAERKAIEDEERRKKEERKAKRKERDDARRKELELKARSDAERKLKEEEKRNKIEIKEDDDKIIFVIRGISFNMIKVQGGRFEMGASKNDGGAMSNEKPRHWVTLSDYCIGETAVTQELWEAVMGNNPSIKKHHAFPVTHITFDDSQSFILKLNQLTGKKFRLPSEAEWEFAARGGNKSQRFWYSGSNEIHEVAWCNTNGVYSVAMLKPNELGIYDMSGNVYEICQDCYDKYSRKEQWNPSVQSGYSRVVRGGCWYSNWNSCRVSARKSSGVLDPGQGFRLALQL